MRGPTVALVLGLLCSVPLTAQQTPHDTLRGAVRVVDVKARTLEVTAGVGMALRVVRLQVPADVSVASRGATLALGDLQPGDIVRVSYGARASGLVAYTIERVGSMAGGPEPTP